MVLSGGSSSARVHGVDRFYCPPPRRQLQEEQRRQAAAAAAKEAEEAAVAAAKEAAEKEASVAARSHQAAIAAERETESSNLERFVASTSPVVPAQFLPRTSMRGRNSDSEEIQLPYFNLSDLWESFKEWSAYGAGVPLVLNGTDSVVQYYVPFLSGIQLFVDKSGPSLSSRRQGEESDGDSYQETCSEASSESENERMVTVGGERRERNESGRGRETSICAYNEGFSSDDSDNCTDTNNNGRRQLLPVFEFFEYDPPYGRQPLADKISLLASKFLELKVYRSCDLLPSSWLSVAWYPIYRIPTGPTLQDLDACFLTFHSLSTPLKSEEGSEPENKMPQIKIRNMNPSNNNNGKLSLPLLGLASYKFKGSIWTTNYPHERELATSLLRAADEWLCHRRVDHPDYRFFLSHYNSSW